MTDDATHDRDRRDAKWLKDQARLLETLWGDRNESTIEGLRRIADRFEAVLDERDALRKELAERKEATT